MLARGTQAGMHALSERKDDLYETPAVAVYALLRVEKLPTYLWEPACGPGAIVKVLREQGHAVYASDLVNYGCPDSHHGFDFLLPCCDYKFLPHHVEAIITNPPFKLAEQFVVRALNLAPRVIMLLRLAFLESARRAPLLDGGLLARVYPFANRLPMMHRAGWEGPRASSATPFAWFVWDINHRGPTEMRRLTLEVA